MERMSRFTSCQPILFSRNECILRCFSLFNGFNSQIEGIGMLRFITQKEAYCGDYKMIIRKYRQCCNCFGF